MKSLNSKLKEFAELLRYTSTNEIYHYDATGDKGDRYIVWQEEGESDPLFLDNQLDEITIKGSLDIYTKVEFDDLVDEVIDLFHKNTVSFNLISVDYETNSNYIHYSFDWEY